LYQKKRVRKEREGRGHTVGTSKRHAKRQKRKAKPNRQVGEVVIQEEGKGGRESGGGLNKRPQVQNFKSTKRTGESVSHRKPKRRGGLKRRKKKKEEKNYRAAQKTTLFHNQETGGKASRLIGLF